MAADARRFGFVQWEFAGRLGPPAGRYVVRRFAGDDVQQVVVVGVVGAEAPAAPRLRRRARHAEPGPAPAEPVVTRVTVIDTGGLEEGAPAAAWLERAAGAEAEEVSARALALVNHAVAAYRVAAADPYVADVAAPDALVARVGYGTGEQVADGAWEAARELPSAAPRRRRDELRPQQRLAALLAGRDVALACEELTLRARADLDLGREREAALQLEAALAAAVAELDSWREQGDLGRRLHELAGHRQAVAAAAAAARAGTLEPAGVEAVAAALGRLEAALRARTRLAEGA